MDNYPYLLLYFTTLFQNNALWMISFSVLVTYLQDKLLELHGEVAC